MNWFKPLACSALFGALLYVAAPAAEAGSIKFKDEERGFKMSVSDKFNQVPPKLTGEDKSKVGNFYVDKAKYGMGYKPTIEVYWFVRAKAGSVTPSDGEGGAPDDDTPPWVAKDTDTAVNQFLERNKHLFGRHIPMAERRADDKKAQSKIKTKSKQVVEILEINYKKPKRGIPKPEAYMLVGRTEIDRPAHIVEVGFVCYAAFSEIKKYKSVFKKAIASFDATADAENTGGRGQSRDIGEMTGDEFADYVIKTKVIKGWSYKKTDNYLLLYNSEVKSGLINDIAQQIEAIRSQIYEKMFPADKKIDALSVVRICKDKSEYGEYGGPSGSAGYWSWPSQELVFYEDKPKKDSLRVLYHEAFHQYIFYSVGDFSPHSWFNEGHGDFFSGHDWKSGRFKTGKFGWRSDSKTLKNTGKAPPLEEWLTWTQGQYYGSNEYGLGGGENYSLGWDFIYFLRTTGKKDYQQILPIYFDVLKTEVTKLRAKLVADAKKDGKEVDKNAIRTATMSKNASFLKLALAKAFDGVDMKKLEKDWLDN